MPWAIQKLICSLPTTFLHLYHSSSPSLTQSRLCLLSVHLSYKAPSRRPLSTTRSTSSQALLSLARVFPTNTSAAAHPQNSPGTAPLQSSSLGAYPDSYCYRACYPHWLLQYINIAPEYSLTLQTRASPNHFSVLLYWPCPPKFQHLGSTGTSCHAFVHCCDQHSRLRLVLGFNFTARIVS